MPMNTADVQHQLVRKFGFSESPTRSDDHIWYELRIPGLPVIATKVSHGEREISSKLEGKMARQLRVHAPYFRRMIECTRSRDEYLQQVQTDPYPPFDVGF